MTLMTNVNCGVLGHIDSGKTSICRALHQVASTASMDKNPQSQERGITLDLGFSSFIIPPENEQESSTQITLVDCPGHASLIRTVLAGSRIIDITLLVVDGCKGFQPQTSECLVVAEIVTSLLVIIVNKIDLLKDTEMTRLEARIRNTMKRTRFGENVPIAYVSALQNSGFDVLISHLQRLVKLVPPRSSTDPLHIAYDHCFQVKGHGTVFSGTVLSGTVRKGQTVSLPHYDVTGEVRSIQSFRTSVDDARQGDRVGICIPKIPSEGKERGDIVDSSVHLIKGNVFVCLIEKIKYFKYPINKCKFHISLGHAHALATVLLLQPMNDRVVNIVAPQVGNSQSLDSMEDLEVAAGAYLSLLTREDLQFELSENDTQCTTRTICLLAFSKEIQTLEQVPIIGSRLDLDESFSGCRLAFFGKLLPVNIGHLASRVVRTVVRSGQIERQYPSDECVYLVKGIGQHTSDMTRFINKTVVHIPPDPRGPLRAPSVSRAFFELASANLCVHSPKAMK